MNIRRFWHTPRTYVCLHVVLSMCHHNTSGDIHSGCSARDNNKVN